MAVIVRADNAEELRDNFLNKISRSAILTWLIDEDGDITIRNPEWHNKAWFRCSVENNPSRLILGIIPSKRYRMTKELYGVFHGRIAATILAHFDDVITSIELTSGYYKPYDVIPE